MIRSLCTLSLGVLALVLSAMAARADGYGPIVTTYSLRPPVVAAYYAPPPVYVAPPPVVYRAYYTPPPVYVAPVPVVSYASPVAVTTYRYGVLPRSQVTTYAYGAPVPVVSSYYIPLYPR